MSDLGAELTSDSFLPSTGLTSADFVSTVLVSTGLASAALVSTGLVSVDLFSVEAAGLDLDSLVSETEFTDTGASVGFAGVEAVAEVVFVLSVLAVFISALVELALVASV